VDDVVRAGHRRVIVLAASQQRDPDQRAPLQVDRPVHLGSDLAAQFGFSFGRRQVREVHHRQRIGHLGCDDLDRCAVPFGKGRPQHFVPPADLVQGEFQRRHVERTFDVQGQVQHVGRPVAFQLVEEPQGFLIQRQRQMTVPRDRHDGG
jgi:hypothetical protein